MRASLLAGAAALKLALSAGTALAQSYTAPAGIPPATAPGGLSGAAGWRNAAEAIDSGQGIAVRGGWADRDVATGAAAARPPRAHRSGFGGVEE
ncbi:hypothetical protein M446_2149 [Methylobacterium sp. 4-46]|uniref:hypothetical protein n=1 Tax=unclassified Methylobacterium TaxID=2615210 RepID=UPI000152DF6D|nr:MULTISPECIES: hypothetical protein [Methylobacterium]ACA16611.1 hypothetical protein M446_2149 [Methylobacterium sp. 4-46]WFT82315.1 hypothetical protein QA634_10890 [Methylobacterium nodulans]